MKLISREVSKDGLISSEIKNKDDGIYVNINVATDEDHFNSSDEEVQEDKCGQQDGDDDNNNSFKQ